MQLKGIRVIVFDLDDTLYPERAFALSGFCAVAGELRRRMECPFDPAERMRELFDSGERRHIFDRVLEELGQNSTVATVEELVALYRSHKPRVELFSDAEAALERWAGRFRLALVSDGFAETQQNKVEALGLEGRLAPIILTGEWGQRFWKPHPRAFEEVEKRTDAAGAECVYIADNPAKDFVAPNRLGWMTVQIKRSVGIYKNAIFPEDGEPRGVLSGLDFLDISS
jgi:putative hydrolase of the HAD superfamily